MSVPVAKRFAHEYIKMSIKIVFFGDCSLFGRKFSDETVRVWEYEQINFAERTIDIFYRNFYLLSQRDKRNFNIEFILSVLLFRFAKYPICSLCDLLKYLNSYRHILSHPALWESGKKWLWEKHTRDAHLVRWLGNEIAASYRWYRSFSPRHKL